LTNVFHLHQILENMKKKKSKKSKKAFTLKQTEP